MQMTRFRYSRVRSTPSNFPIRYTGCYAFTLNLDCLLLIVQFDVISTQFTFKQHPIFEHDILKMKYFALNLFSILNCEFAPFFQVVLLWHCDTVIWFTCLICTQLFTLYFVNKPQLTGDWSGNDSISQQTRQIHQVNSIDYEI